MPVTRFLKSMLAFAALAGASFFAIGTAQAHPHVWITMETTVVYEGGKIAGLRHKWTFDDMYTAMAIQGLDTNGDGTYSREELKELAQVNIDGLKEFEYFTHMKLGEKKLELAPPKDYYLEHKDNLLSLYLTVPLKEPVLAEAEGFSFSVYDETFFIALEYPNEKAVVIGEGAPKDCTASMGIPKEDLDQLQALNNSFGGQLTAGDQNMGLGAGYAKTITVGCKKA